MSNTNLSTVDWAADKIARQINRLVEGDVAAELSAVLASDEYAALHAEAVRTRLLVDPCPQVSVAGVWLDCHGFRTPWGDQIVSLATKNDACYVSISEEDFRALITSGRARYGTPQAPKAGATRGSGVIVTSLCLALSLWMGAPAVRGVAALVGALQLVEGAEAAGFPDVRFASHSLVGR